MSEVYLSDNAGNKVPPHPDLSDPVLGSGQNVSAAATDTDAEVVVVAGESYAITCIKGAHIFGIADTGTATNCIWACGSGKTIIVKIPAGYSALHYQTPDSSRRFILRKLKDPGD